MNEFEQMEYMNVQLEADLKRTKEKLQEVERTNRVLQDRLDMSNSCCRQKDTEKQAVIAQLAEAERTIKELHECKDAQIVDLEYRLKSIEEEYARMKEINEGYNKTFSDLLSQKSDMERLLSDERTKNEELTTIIDCLARTVHNLSSCLK